MSNVKVLITQVSGERLWGTDTSLPSQLQISVNVNLLGFERKSPEKIEAPFVFTASFTPSVAHINIKGRAQTSGEKSELDRIMEEHKSKKPPPNMIVQAVSSIAIAESIVIAKTIGVPPPLPPFPGTQKQETKTDTKYTT